MCDIPGPNFVMKYSMNHAPNQFRVKIILNFPKL